MTNNSAVSLGNCSKALFKPEEDNTRSQNALEEVPFDNSFDSISKPQRKRVIISNTQKSLTKRYLSNSQIVKGRILKTMKREKRCCCAFYKLFGNEMTTNNQMYNLVKGRSFLVLPVMRISIVFFAILLEFASTPSSTASTLLKKTHPYCGRESWRMCGSPSTHSCSRFFLSRQLDYVSVLPRKRERSSSQLKT